MSQRRILITGGAGFIGSCLAEKLVKDQNNHVVIVDNLLTGKKGRLPKQDNNNWKFIKCDVNNFKDISTIMTSYNFDYVFHYAAVVGVQRTLENPALVLGDIEGIRNILDLSKNSNVNRVFFSSSSEVYGEPFEHPQNEQTTPLNSRLPYAVVKNVGEAFLKAYKTEYDLDYTVFRFFNTYGSKQSSDFVMTKFLKAALRNETIFIYGDGSQTRTFCHVSDNIDATAMAMYNDLYINDTVNIGNDREIRILDLAKVIVELTGSKSEIQHLDPLEEGDMLRRKPDISKMKKLLNRDLVDLETGIRQMLDNAKFAKKLAYQNA